ncbi:hypothetical protein B0H17DRAFT_1027103 [Mycena rosella]|uniref:Uncharacterized protein n=1 Tax=Mycena rosella TaxID=1033263 RepID=A0AAD7H234_MYCRO|nr:hypothetical protein B0H17DRAFT_1027103 [Mycena rosella]
MYQSLKSLQASPVAPALKASTHVPLVPYAPIVTQAPQDYSKPCKILSNPLVPLVTPQPAFHLKPAPSDFSRLNTPIQPT